VENSSPKFLATFVLSKKMLKVNNHPMVENSPNLVTLIGRLNMETATRLKSMWQLTFQLHLFARVARWFLFRPKIPIWVNF
jgi:hypothetical protein